MSVSSRSSVQDDNDVTDDVESTLLYNILVYREWPPTPESKTSETPQNSESAASSTEGWKDRISSWVKLSGGKIYDIKGHCWVCFFHVSLTSLLGVVAYTVSNVCDM